MYELDDENIEFECPYCRNDAITQTAAEYYSSAETCPECGGELEDDGYCEECGWGDVNQGWVGENYG